MVESVQIGNRHRTNNLRQTARGIFNAEDCDHGCRTKNALRLHINGQRIEIGQKGDYIKCSLFLKRLLAY